MTATILPQIVTELTIDATTATRIAALIKQSQPDNASLRRALDNAIDDIANGRAFTLRGNVLECQSSEHDTIFYTTSIDVCECETQRGVCRHRAKLAILMAHQTISAAALMCQPLTAPVQPARRARVATGARAATIMAAPEWEIRRAAERARIRTLSQDELEAACNWE